MNAEQKKSLDRVRATKAHMDYLESNRAVYSSEDVSLVLEILEEKIQTLELVVQDLQMVKTYLESNPAATGIDTVLLGMIESTVAYIEYGDLT